MNYVKNLKYKGVRAKEIPSIPGNGAPTKETEGAVGCLYMDKNTGAMYKCTAVNAGVYTWEWLPDGFYHTTREETSITTAQQVYDLYDALMAQFPDNVVKKEYTVGDFTNYVYEISTGEYSTEGAYIYRGNDPYIKKPKFLVLSAIHGEERKAAFSAYRFIRDVLSGCNIPQAFREGAIISIMPVGTPAAFDTFTRGRQLKTDDGEFVTTEDGEIVEVDINRDFASDTPQAETQAIKNWLSDNSDAEAFIDLHNNGALNEKVVIIGLPDNSKSNNARKIALRGVSKVIPYWRDVIGYPLVVEANGMSIGVNENGEEVKVEEVKNRDVIFSYSSTVENDKMAKSYAQNVVGITSITVETVAYYGSHTEWGGHTSQKDSPEAVAMGAEALGNILIEFYENEVSNMADIDSKLDTIIQKLSFYTRSGTFVPKENKNICDEVNCEPNAKIVYIEMIDTPSESTASVMPIRYGFVSPVMQQHQQKVSEEYGGAFMMYVAPNKDTPNMTTSICDFSNGISFSTPAALVFEAGKTYKWTAYYWND